MSDISPENSRAVNINETCTLITDSAKKYRFNMDNIWGQGYQGFTIRTSNISTSGKIKYMISILENSNVIYRSGFTSGTILRMNAEAKSTYIVNITNLDGKDLTMNIKINGYIQ